MRCFLRTASLFGLLAAVILAAGQATQVAAANFIPGMLSVPGSFSRPDGAILPALFADPAEIRSDSATVSFGYNAENLLRTRENGRLVSNMQTWGDTQCMVLPLHLSKQPTALALSRTSSNASLFRSDPDTGTRLDWASDSRQWGLSHSIGRTKIGITSSSSSAAAPGSSLYPSQACNIFSGWTHVQFSLAGRETVLQTARPVGRRSEVSLKLGSDVSRLRVDIGEDASLLSVPVSSTSYIYGIGLKQQLMATTSADLDYYCSTAASQTHLYRAGDPIGRLKYAPGYSQLAIRLDYRRRPDSLWQAGFSRSRWVLGLQGISIDGDQLGLNLKPFSERIDFVADAGLSVDMLHVGMDRRMSDKWSWGWRYRLARVKSSIDGDYYGRAFFGLVTISGTYDKTLVAARVHGLELSARYKHKRSSFELTLAQIVPQSASADRPPTQEEPVEVVKTKSTGGTSLSVVTSYEL